MVLEINQCIHCRYIFPFDGVNSQESIVSRATLPDVEAYEEFVVYIMEWRRNSDSSTCTIMEYVQRNRE